MSKVVKFGGSSLADATQFQKVYNIIKSDPERRFVVPSAPGKRFKEDTKVTDLLYKIFYAKTKNEFHLYFDQMKERFLDIIEGLQLDLSLEDEFTIIQKALENELKSITLADIIKDTQYYIQNEKKENVSEYNE